MNNSNRNPWVVEGVGGNRGAALGPRGSSYRAQRRGCGRGTELGLAESQAPVQEETDDAFREVAPRWCLMSDRAPETA